MPRGRGAGREEEPAVAESMEEIKKSLNYMSAEITKLSSQQEKLVGMMEEIKTLKLMVQEKDKKIHELERRVDDLEQYSRREEVIISGLKTTHRTYARVASGETTTEDAPQGEMQSLEQQVVSFLQSKDINIKQETISVCHTLPSRTDEPTIVIRFTSRKMKVDLLTQARKLKGTKVYINEHLTKKNADIAREARFLKKQKLIVATWTRNGNIWIKAGERSQAKIIKDKKELDEFRRRQTSQ